MDERTPPYPEADQTIGANKPPTAYDDRAARTNDIVAVGEAWMKVEAIESQAQAERLADQIELVSAAAKENEKARKAEVDPLNAQVKEISGRYKRLGSAENLSGLDPTSFLGIMAAKLKTLKAGWLDRLDRERKAEEEKARQEAEDARRKAEEAAAKTDTIAGQIAAEDARKAAEEAAAHAQEVAEKKVALKGEIGQRATGFRMLWKATAITNLDKALARYRNRPEIAELLLRLANAEVRAGKRKLPGFKVEETKSL